MRLAALLILAAVLSAEDAGKFMRPSDGAALPSGTIDIVATAPAGKLELDGKPVKAEEPFPNVFHASLKADPGVHSLKLVWEGGHKEIRIFTGQNAPAEFQVFHQHPPLAGVVCTQCHEVSQRGHFRFKGGCFDCHQQDSFVKVHTHKPDVLNECGICHNAHGSTVKAHLLYPKETACKQCHN